MSSTVFVRHGESVWNRRGLIQGQAEAPGLSPKGRHQAGHIVDAVRDLDVDLVLTSDLARARETAQVVASQLRVPVAVDVRLRERHLGDVQGLPSSAVNSRRYGVAEGRVVDPDAAPDGGETLRQFACRVGAVLLDLARQAERSTVVVVSHGGFIRLAQGLLVGTPLPGMAWGDVANASCWRTTLSLGDGSLGDGPVLEHGDERRLGVVGQDLPAVPAGARHQVTQLLLGDEQPGEPRRRRLAIPDP